MCDRRGLGRDQARREAGSCKSAMKAISGEPLKVHGQEEPTEGHERQSVFHFAASPSGTHVLDRPSRLDVVALTKMIHRQ
jgi:hypothetical protein